MRLLHIIPYIVLLLVGQAALDALPVVVAEREGGMGLGSALIVAHVVQIAGIAFGSVAAAYVVDRGSTPTALLAGALLYYAGLIAVAMAPMGALSWVMVSLGLAGSGFGLILTAAFSVAAGVGTRGRPWAVMLLLLAPLAARSLIGPLSLAGSLALTAAAAIVVALSVLPARFAGVGSTRNSMRLSAADMGNGKQLLSTRAALVGGMLWTVGVLGTLGGADPSRVSAAVLAGFLGLDGLDVLDGSRAGMVVVGLAMVVGGSVVLLVRQRPDQKVLLAVPAIALAAVPAAGTIAALSLAIRMGGTPPGDPTVLVAGVAALGGSAFGLALGGWWLARGGEPRVVAIAGNLVLAGMTIFGVVALTGSTSADASAPLGALAVIGFGGGLAAIALRLVLAETAVHQRGIAAGSGVVAASFGSALGSMVGTGEGMRLVTGEPDTIAAGAIVLIAAAVAAVAVAGLLPSSGPASL